MNVLTIDPGARYVAWAFSAQDSESHYHIEHYGLARAEQINERFLTEMDPLIVSQAVVNALLLQFLEKSIGDIDKVVVERPKVYSGWKMVGDPNDLLNVGIIIGVMASLVSLDSSVQSVLPEVWKGQVPKETHHKRIDEFFKGPNNVSLKELGMWKRVSKLKKHHNERDAIALALWATGRVGKGGEKL